MRRLLYLLVIATALTLTSCGNGESGDNGGQPSDATTTRPAGAATETDATGGGDPPARGEQETPPPPPPVPPLTFGKALPDDPIATVNGEKVPLSALLELLLKENLGMTMGALVQSKILELELQKLELTVSDEEREEELATMIETSAPGKTLEDIEKEGSTNIDHLRTQARTQRGWKKIFWKLQKIPEDQRHEQINTLLLQFIVRQRMDGYELKMRGREPQPPGGLVALIKDKASGNEIPITADEALDFLVGLIRSQAILSARDTLVEKTIIDQAMAEAEAKVTEAEIAAWAAEMHAKHAPPFTWEMIAKTKGTTVEREMERWRRIQAWKQITDTNPTKDEVHAFRKQNEEFFRGAHKKVSHILVRSTDQVSNESLGPEAEAEAARKIKLIHQKAREGVEFGYLAENYSDDTVTARGKGKLAQPIKKWGGNLDPAFQEAAWSLKEIGAISEPVKSSFGWHVIRLDEDNPGKTPASWDDPRYFDWIQEEYETRQMKEWAEKLCDSAEVELEPDEAILKIKEMEFFPK